MKTSSWLIIDRDGIKATRKTKPPLDWDEIAIKVNLEVPNELFQRPTIEATVTVTDVPNNAYEPEIIINTKELIEQQTGAKINFKVIQDEPTNE